MSDHGARGGVEKQAAIMEAMADEYSSQLDASMGLLHNQFVAFIASAGIPLPNVMLVLEMLKKEIVDQASTKYLGA